MKPGRPKLYKRPEGQACEICRCLRTDGNGQLQCAAGRILDPVNCADFRDVSRHINFTGGTSGVFYDK